MPKTTNKTELKETLRKAGSKATPARLKVLALLTKSAEALSIKDILKALRSSAVDQATLYRMMEALEKSGLVRQVNLQHGHVHYELAAGKHHHHIVCENCGKVVDISKCNVKSLEKQALKLAKFSVVRHHSLELFGVCHKCAKKIV